MKENGGERGGFLGSAEREGEGERRER